MSVDKFGRQSSSQSSAMAPGASVRYVNNNFIRRDGSNDIEGELSMNNHKLVNLSEPTEVQDAATRGYVKNFTRNNFLKIDGTNNMEGDLNVNNHNIINLSDPVDDGDVITKSYLESTTFKRDGSDSMGGDLNMSNNKIVNVAWPTSDHDVVNKVYADSVVSTVITIWAQENGPLNRGEYEWSFGSGDLYTLAKCGYCMPTPGRILRGSISSAHDSDNTDDIRPAVVRIVINGQVTDNEISKPNGVFSHTDVFNPPISVAQNDRINFQTFSNTSNAVNTIVSLLIALDL